MAVKSRKYNTFLKVTVNGKDYLGRFASCITLEKQTMDNLIKNNSWLVSIESFNSDVKRGRTYIVPDALQFSDHSSKMPWLRLEGARKVIEEKVVEFHKSLYI